MEASKYENRAVVRFGTLVTLALSAQAASVAVAPWNTNGPCGLETYTQISPPPYHKANSPSHRGMLVNSSRLFQELGGEIDERFLQSIVSFR